MMTGLSRPLDAEQRASLQIMVAARWLLIGAALIVVNYRSGTTPEAFALLNLLAVGGGALNAALFLALRGGRQIATGLPVFVGLYDACAVTGAIVAADGFDNTGFLLYYPALLAFSLVFPGWWSVFYAAGIIGAYAVVSVAVHDAFDVRSVADQKSLAMRLVTMAATVLIAHMTVRIERGRRQRAVAAEAARSAEVLALEVQARETERAAEGERRRVSEEIHDGIAQSIYMLTLGLETNAALAERTPGDARLAEQMGALVRLAKGTLLETRNLLFDLSPVMLGEAELGSLVRNQAAEFAAVTGIEVDVCVQGEERPLAAARVADVYRVLQEGLANVYKHAGARAVEVGLTYDAGGLTLRVADNGAGFDPGATSGRGHGLRNMRTRAERLGGRLAIESETRRGTVLTVSIPFEGG